jgi:hypothetical protein
MADIVPGMSGIVSAWRSRPVAGPRPAPPILSNGEEDNA